MLVSDLSEEEKEKKHQYCCERCKNLLEDEKQRLVEYKTNESIMQKVFLIFL